MSPDSRAGGSIGAQVAAGGCWPTAEQDLLLRASLLPGAEAIEAWREWVSGVDFRSLDTQSRRLLPLLYRNLQAHGVGVEGPLEETFKRIYRWTWQSNHLHLRLMADLLKLFHAFGIQTMVLKGAALTPLYYGDYGLRPMGDLDLLVPRQQAPRAIELLTEGGWWPRDQGQGGAFPSTLLSVLHGSCFVNEAGQNLDLHWHLMAECCYEGADEDWWGAAAPIEIGGVRTLALSPADTLLQVFVRGTWWNPSPVTRWVADAMTIIQAAEPEVDWERLVAQARKRRLVLHAGSALRYLSNLLRAPVPEATLRSLEEAAVSRVERLEYRVRGRPKGLFGPLLAHWFLYLRSSQLERLPALRPAFSGFPRYMQRYWGLPRLWRLPFHALALATRRLGRFVGLAAGGRP